MSSARRPHLDQRRRMVIYSQRREDGEATRETTWQPRSSEDLYSRRNTASYGSRVHRRLRARWYGLVPVKRRALLTFVASLCGLVAILAWGHWAALWWVPIAMRPDVARPLQLDRPDSFGAWFGAVFLAMTSGAALLVYQLRRYRSDDYHGHYRLWRIVIVVAMLASIDSVTQLTDWLGATLDAVFGQREIMAGSDWVRILWMIGGAAFAIRLTGEVWKDRTASILMGITWSLFAVPAATHWNLIHWEMETGVFWLPVLSLAARTFMFVTVVTYLRTLYREVRGLAEKDRLHDRIRAVMPESWGRRLRMDPPGSSGPTEEPPPRKRKSRKAEPSLEETPAATPEGAHSSSRWWNRWRKGSKGLSHDGSSDARQSVSDEERENSRLQSERRESIGTKVQSKQTVAASSMTQRGSRNQPEPVDNESETENDDTAEAKAHRRGWSLRMPKWRGRANDEGITQDPMAHEAKPSWNENPKDTPSGDSEAGGGERRRWWSLNRTAKDTNRSVAQGQQKARIDAGRMEKEEDASGKRRWWSMRRSKDGVTEEGTQNASEFSQEISNDSNRRRWWPLRRSKVAVDLASDEGIKGKGLQADQEDVAKRRWWSRKDRHNLSENGEGQDGNQSHELSEPAEPRKRRWWHAFKSRAEASEVTPYEEGGAMESGSRKVLAKAVRSTDEIESRGGPSRSTQNTFNKGPLPVRDVVRKASDAEPENDSYDENDDDDDQSDPRYANMSKAERRRLRKLQKRQGKAA